MTEATSLSQDQVKQSKFKTFMLKFFSLLNTFRKIIVNTVFFVILLLFITTLGSDEGKIIIPKNSALLLNLSGDIVEQKHSIDPLNAFMT